MIARALSTAPSLGRELRTRTNLAPDRFRFVDGICYRALSHSRRVLLNRFHPGVRWTVSTTILVAPLSTNLLGSLEPTPRCREQVAIHRRALTTEPLNTDVVLTAVSEDFHPSFDPRNERVKTDMNYVFEVGITIMRISL